MEPACCTPLYHSSFEIKAIDLDRLSDRPKHGLPRFPMGVELHLTRECVVRKNKNKKKRQKLTLAASEPLYTLLPTADCGRALRSHSAARVYTRRSSISYSRVNRNFVGLQPLRWASRDKAQAHKLESDHYITGTHRPLNSLSLALW